MILVVEEELGRIDEVLLDVMHGRGGAAGQGEGKAVLADVARPGDEVLPVRVEPEIGEYVGERCVVLNGLDRVLGYVEPVHPGAPHGLGEHDCRADIALWRVIGDAGAPVVPPDVEIDVRGKVYPNTISLNERIPRPQWM